MCIYKTNYTLTCTIFTVSVTLFNLNLTCVAPSFQSSIRFHFTMRGMKNVSFCCLEIVLIFKNKFVFIVAKIWNCSTHALAFRHLGMC